MEKTVIEPGFGDLDSEIVDHAVFSWGVVTEHSNHRRVCLSGGGWPEGDVQEQTREILGYVEETLVDLGGSMDDIVMTRFYVRSNILSRETQARIHEVRADFFDYPEYPASTMLGVADLLGDDMLVEIEAEAEIPDDEWSAEVVD
ncbi:RidA family protein [Haladaptatus sp. DYF46]|uniref:RidA family protein n=1 Tax=Haladaptatus sp. DYF46 TaxID=2886041 RepID=UPI001E28D28B|nr:RidA family protein [Haladaptatus sp. DYF46]